jgi:hypothetical protein
LSSSQKQFDAYWRQAMPGPVMSPVEWANRMMQAMANPFSPSPPGANHAADHPGPKTEPPREGLDELRRQVGELQRKLDELGDERPPT